MSEEKTEKPTPKKKRESRKEGQVPRTQEFGGWGSLALVSLALPWLLDTELGRLRVLMTSAVSWEEQPSAAQALQMLGTGASHAFWSVLLLSLCIMVVGVAATLAQGGFYVASKAVKPSFAKLNPIKGAKRLFGPQALWEGVKILVKSTLVALVAWHGLRSILPLMGGLVPIDAVLEVAGDTAHSLLRNVAVLGFVIAAADYAMARRRIGKQTRMSHSEIKQEHKQSEGDPLLKGAIRSRQMAMSRNRMMADVPQADVVLVNPTHIAVALRYAPERGAPVVVASGAGAIAQRIREVATEARVPLVRDVPLARSLHRSTKVGQQIPPELFTAVATVLAFVINQKRHGHHAGEHRSPRRGEELPVVPRVRARTPRASGA